MYREKEEKMKTSIASVDISKVYDRVWREGLWMNLRVVMGYTREVC